MLLENSLIKEHKPFYNIQLKDDKTYPFIVIKKERFPRIFATRQLIRDGSEYFGPFPSVKVMHTVLDLCRKLYPIRTCALALTEENIANGKFRVCLEYHIGNCKGPCVGKQSEEAYAQHRGHPPRFARTLGEVVRTLQSQMAEAAEAFQFEEAEQYKRKLPLSKSTRPKTPSSTPASRKSRVLHRARRAVRLCQLPEDPERHHHQGPHLGGAAQTRRGHQGNP